MPVFTHGKNTVFYISDGTSSPVATASGAVAVAKVYDISPYCKDVQFPSKIDIAETSTFGTAVKTYVQGLADRTISFSGSWEGTASGISDTTATNATSFDALMAGLIGAGNPVVFVYGPVGAATGKMKYVGSGILTDYSILGGLSTLVEFNGALQVSGAPTRTTF